MGNEVSDASQGSGSQSPVENEFADTFPDFSSRCEYEEGARRRSLSNLQSNLADLVIDDPDKIINILLLGETGVGKSTFINSMVNYLSFQNFEKAEKNDLIILIPTSFTAYDKDGNNVRLEVGDKHKNENLTVGSSVTQLIRTYTFSIKGGYRLRLIDTPGMGDTRGPQQDEQNCEYILGYISNLKSLHAICYLFRPQASRATVHFRYCMTQILSRLEKSACDNLIFIFTDSKDFTPGETYSILKKLAEDIKKSPPHATIPVDQNKFCFDNDPFKFLAAKQRGVQFALDIRQIMSASWAKSTEQCWKLIEYISMLKPHNVRNTAAINECRRIIYQLSQPMAEIAQLIDDNLYVLQRHEDTMKQDEISIEQLKEKLFIPVVDLEVKELSKPVTVCTSLKCAEPYKVGERTKWHYKARCHNPCYLTNVTKDIIGDPALIGCHAMSGTENCTQCGCHYKQHMHVYYESTTVQKEKLDQSVQKNVNSKEAVLDNARKVLAEIKKKKNELEDELEIIIRSNAKFAYFLQNNAITPINDCYEDYIKHLIEVEKRLGSKADKSKLQSLKQMLDQHNQIKATLIRAEQDRAKIGSASAVVTPDDIQCCVEELYKLKHNGLTIEKMFNAQNQSRESEYLDSEYVHVGEFDRQPQDEEGEDSNTDSNENCQQGTRTRISKPNQQQNRGRGQQRGRGYRGNSRSRGNYNTQNRQSYQRGDVPPGAPPTYDQSRRDSGRTGAPNYNQNENGQTRFNAGGRGGFARQTSASDRRDPSFPKIEVNVTVPPKPTQTSSRGGHNSNYHHQYAGYQSQNVYPQEYQRGNNNYQNENRPPRNDYRTGGGQNEASYARESYRAYHPQANRFNTNPTREFPQEYADPRANPQHPPQTNRLNTDPVREYPQEHGYPRAGPQQFPQDRDYYPTRRADFYGDYAPPRYPPPHDNQPREHPGQPHNIGPRDIRDGYPSYASGGYPSHASNPREYHQRQHQPNVDPRGPSQPGQPLYAVPQAAQVDLRRDEYPTNDPRISGEYIATHEPRYAAGGSQECPTSQTASKVAFDGYAPLENSTLVKLHPTIAGDVVIEDYPRSVTPRNQPRYGGYSYSEQTGNYAAERPADLPVGAPRQDAPPYSRKEQSGREYFDRPKAVDEPVPSPSYAHQPKDYYESGNLYQNQQHEHLGPAIPKPTSGAQLRESTGTLYPKLDDKDSRYDDRPKTFPEQTVTAVNDVIRRAEISDHSPRPPRSIDDLQRGSGPQVPREPPYEHQNDKIRRPEVSDYPPSRPPRAVDDFQRGNVPKDPQYDMIRRTEVDNGPVRPPRSLDTSNVPRDPQYEHEKRTYTEKHPENPFQTFEFELMNLGQNSSQSTNPLPTEDLISFDPYSSEYKNSPPRNSGSAGKFPEEFFGNIDNPVRVITQKTYGPGEYPPETQKSYSRVENYQEQQEYKSRPQKYQDASQTTENRENYSYPRTEYPPQPQNSGQYPPQPQNSGQYPPQPQNSDHCPPQPQDSGHEYRVREYPPQN